MIIEITDNNFDEVVLKSRKPIVLDLWAPWCGPCKGLTPILEELSKIYHENIDVATCNIDENPLIARRLNIRSIPTVMFFRDGILKNTQIGLRSKKMYETEITELIS